MKRALQIILYLSVSIVVNAQNNGGSHMDSSMEYGDSILSSYKKFRDEVLSGYHDFRNEVMREYIEFVRSAWQETEDSDPVPAPRIEPVPPISPPHIDEEFAPVVVPLKIDTLLEFPLPKPDVRTRPDEIIFVTPVAVETYLDFVFFGTELKVRFDAAHRIGLDALDENSVADALEMMVSDASEKVVADCLDIRENMALSDWAYIQMLKSLATAAYGSYSDSAVLFMAYIYMRSGYKMRLATDGSRLYMLFATEHTIFNRPSYSIEGDNYYCLEDLPSCLNVCMASYSGEVPLSLMLTGPQNFERNNVSGKPVVSKKYADMNATVTINSNLLVFYSTYPKSMIGGNMMTCWAMYANAPIDDGIRKQLNAQLYGAIDGLPELEAVDKILNFVQTGLVYEYDEKVWGADRPFFAEECLYYEFADCEDRSILFTKLVRELVGLDVALLFVPGHILAAVRFNQDVGGKCIYIDGERFVICEPTCLNGASVGWCDIDDDEKIEVIRL